jgi:streptogramin lyase
VVTTLAGTFRVSGTTNGKKTAASFDDPEGIAVDSSGNVYISEASKNIIRKITSQGVVTTLAGSAGVEGSTNGIGSAASFHHPEGITVDRTGNVYVADAGNNIIRRITPNGEVTTLSLPTDNLEKNHEGGFYDPTAIAVDSQGIFYIADRGSNQIFKSNSAYVP